MPKLSFSDKNGFETLASVQQAPAFNRWMYDVIKTHCTGNILEAGSGIGTISQCFIDDKKEITVSDFNPEYFAFLHEKYSAHTFVKNILQLDLVHPEFSEIYSEHLGKYDCVVALNVIEHVQHDEQALQNIQALLKNEGKLILLVPANRFLYNTLDKALGHYRRYNAKKIEQLFQKTEFETLHIQYFNIAAIPGWFLAGNVFKNTSLHAGSMKLYNSLVPLFRVADKCLFHKLGISVIGVGRKKKK